MTSSPRSSEDGPGIVVVPHGELSPELLRAVVESFVMREGTDYGAREYSLAEKVAQVVAQLARGEARIVFDSQTETVGIVIADGQARGAS